MADRLERLINLVIALRETRRPLSAAEIHERVAGYGQADHEAFRRTFERDKADLRALGVPLETAPVDVWGDRYGYRIDPARYDLPDLRLEPDELAALAVAVQATGLGDEAAAGLRKLEVDAGEPGIGDLAASLPVDVHLDVPHSRLVEAQASRTPVRFTYRVPGSEPSVRTVDPHALVHRRGRWYVVGRDHDRDGRRAFRLDRIEGDVRLAGQPGAFPPPEQEVGVADVVPEPPPGAPATAVVLAAPDVAWSVARRACGGGAAREDGWTAYTVTVGDPDTFVSWVLGHGPSLEVQAPSELRARVVAALRRLAGEAGT